LVTYRIQRARNVGVLTDADVLPSYVDLVALAAAALVAAPGVLAAAVGAGARQLLPALVQI
jgi:hypothetical protein